MIATSSALCRRWGRSGRVCGWEGMEDTIIGVALSWRSNAHSAPSPFDRIKTASEPKRLRAFIAFALRLLLAPFIH